MILRPIVAKRFPALSKTVEALDLDVVADVEAEAGVRPPSRHRASVHDVVLVAEQLGRAAVPHDNDSRP
jgi:hypothetical protein